MTVVNMVDSSLKRRTKVFLIQREVSHKEGRRSNEAEHHVRYPLTVAFRQFLETRGNAVDPPFHFAPKRVIVEEALSELAEMGHDLIPG